MTSCISGLVESYLLLVLGLWIGSDGKVGRFSGVCEPWRVWEVIFCFDNEPVEHLKVKGSY